MIRLQGHCSAVLTLEGLYIMPDSFEQSSPVSLGPRESAADYVALRRQVRRGEFPAATLEDIEDEK